MSHEADALDQMRAAGLEPRDGIEFGAGRIRRFRVQGDKSGKRNGWYRTFEDGEHVTIVFGTWKEPEHKVVWSSRGNGEKLTREQQDEIKRQITEHKRRETARKKRAAKRYEALYSRAKPADPAHPYLTKKGIHPGAIRQTGNRLLVPMRSTETRKVASVQAIGADGFKRFAKGGQASGVYFGIGSPSDSARLYVCEGFATGRSIFEATGQAVAIGFTAHNLSAVSKSMRGLFPTLEIIVCADNDQWTTVRVGGVERKNPGVYYAQQAASAIGAECVWPEFAALDGKPTDFNDLRQREGDEQVTRQLSGIRPEPELPEPDDDAPHDEIEDAESWRPAGEPFIPLGYNETRYYYLPAATEQIAEIRRAGHTSASELLSLAPLEWWQHMHPNKSGDAVNWQSAGSALMRRCEARGVFDPAKVRGRGAWYDDGQPVLHLGNSLMVAGRKKAIRDHRSHWFYTKQAAIETGTDAEPAQREESAVVVELIRQLNFSTPSDAMLLAGWCALAPICGALQWRPHIWVTAPRGAGKSWAQNNIIYPLVGPLALHVQGNTSEAGIRQRLGSDARPVIFDEAESEDQSQARRIQSVIELARQASTDSGAEILKGTSGGDGLSYRSRSMFLMGSINVSLARAADESRFSVLTMHAPPSSVEEIRRFDRFAAEVDATITPRLCSAIRARMYRAIPTVRQNALIFAQAVAEVIGSQRIGDQLGTLLAGYFALTADGVTDAGTARAICEQIDYTEAREAEAVRDEESLLQTLLQTQVRFDEPGGKGSMMRSLGELVQRAAGIDTSAEMSQADANEVLRRHGMRVDGRALLVANSHVEIKRALTNTPWGSGWRRVLMRADGAESGQVSARFGSGVSRYVSVPVDSLPPMM